MFRFISLAMVMIVTGCVTSTQYQDRVGTIAVQDIQRQAVALANPVITVTARELGRGGLVGFPERGTVCFRHHLAGHVVQLCTNEFKWESPRKPYLFTFELSHFATGMPVYRDVNWGGWYRSYPRTSITIYHYHSGRSRYTEPGRYRGYYGGTRHNPCFKDNKWYC